MNVWETECSESPDKKHCVHWYDDEDTPCCYCGDNRPAVIAGITRDRQPHS